MGSFRLPFLCVGETSRKLCTVSGFFGETFSLSFVSTVSRKLREKENRKITILVSGIRRVKGRRSALHYGVYWSILSRSVTPAQSLCV